MKWPDESVAGCLHTSASPPRTGKSRRSHCGEDGLGELANGELLRVAELAGFELFIICDKNLRYQQNLAGRRLAILELRTNHRPTLEKHFPLIRQNAEAMQSGEYRVIAAP